MSQPIHAHPPPPPPVPVMRGSTPGPPPQPAGFRPQMQGGGPGPQMMQMPFRQMPVMQNGTRISNITPPRSLDELEYLKLLTIYRVYTIRKVTPQSLREKATWAVAEISEERLEQSEIAKAIKRLNESKKTVSDKKAALAQNQQGQINSLLDGLVSDERDPNFEWSLVQLDSYQRPVSSRESRKKLYETVTMTVYVKRAPIKSKNATILWREIEQEKIDRQRMMQEAAARQRQQQQQQQQQQQHQQQQQQYPHPPPQHHQGPPGPQGGGHSGPHPGANGGHPGPAIINLGRTGGGHHPKALKLKRSRSKKHRAHHDDSSMSSLSDSESASEASSEESSRSSYSSSESDRRERRRRSVSRGPTRSHERPRPATRFIEGPRSPSPRRHFGEERRRSDAYGGIPQPRAYVVPDVPRMVPATDPISSAYQAGKEDAMKERFGSPERELQQPVIIERIIERPQPVISYGRPEPRYVEPRRIGPTRLIQERYVEDIDPRDDYVVRRQEAQEYINRGPQLQPRSEYHRTLEPRHEIPRRASSPISPISPISPTGRFSRPLHSPPEEAFGRRASSPVRTRFPGHPNPFSPKALPRRYPRADSSTDTGSYGDGW